MSAKMPRLTPHQVFEAVEYLGALGALITCLLSRNEEEATVMGKLLPFAAFDKLEYESKSDREVLLRVTRDTCEVGVKLIDQYFADKN